MQNRRPLVAESNSSYVEQTQREYDRYRLRSLYHRTVAEKEEEFVVDMLRPGRDLVLEVGPGVGRFTRHLAELAKTLVVCDVSEELLKKVAARLGPRPNVDYRNVGLERLASAPEYGRLDAVVAVRVVPHAADWRAALERLTWAVRPGGLVLFDLWCRQSFVGLLMKIFPPREPVPVHRLTRREIDAAIAALPAAPIGAYRWGYPRLGVFHLDSPGSALAPSWAYSTLYCLRRDG